jgi:hypothetical protein
MARTTKTVTGTFKATFHGDYLSADEVVFHLEQWIDAGLDDRDDLKGWTFSVEAVTEATGDPEGFDA